MHFIVKTIFVFAALFAGYALMVFSSTVKTESKSPFEYKVEDETIFLKSLKNKKEKIVFKDYNETKKENNYTDSYTVREFLGIDNDGLNDIREYLGRDKTEFTEKEKYVEKKKTFFMEITEKEGKPVPDSEINSYGKDWEEF